MPTYALRGLDRDAITRAEQRAREDGTTLDAVLQAFIVSYAAGHDSPAQQFGAIGGRARAVRLTAEERSEAARRAVTARWAKVP